MSNKFEELLAQLVEQDELDEDVAEQIRKASTGSPLRAQIAELQESNEQLKTRNQTLETTVMQTTFAEALKDAKVKLDPNDLKLPDDLDVTDVEKVRAWAVEKGYVDKPQSSTDEELEGHEQIANAGTGAQTAAGGKITVETVAKWDVTDQLRFAEKNPDAWEALKRGEDVALGSVA